MAKRLCLTANERQILDDLADAIRSDPDYFSELAYSAKYPKSDPLDEPGYDLDIAGSMLELLIRVIERAPTC
jgi:hypothetical protein